MFLIENIVLQNKQALYVWDRSLLEYLYQLKLTVRPEIKSRLKKQEY